MKNLNIKTTWVLGALLTASGVASAQTSDCAAFKATA